MKYYLLKASSAFLFITLLLLSSCSDLDEEVFGSLSPDNYYQNEEEALSSVAGVYENLSAIVNYGDAWRLSVYGTDEFIIAARTNGGWFDGGLHIAFTEHAVAPENPANGDAWDTIFGVIGAANAVQQSLEQSPRADEFAALIAEIRAMRAYAYFYAMDYWGNVPIFTDARIDPANLPSTNTRAVLFDFVETEFLEAADNLPSISDVDRANYYPRFTKESVFGALARIYLNAEVYTGNARWEDAIEMSDRIIGKEGSQGYILEPEFISNFTGNNNNSGELISAFTIEPAQNAGGNTYLRGALNPLHQLTYDLPFVPANGFNTYQDAFERYGENDIRANYIVQGPQTYLNGDPLLDDEGNQLTLIPVQDYTSAEANEGFRVLKYVPDGNWVGRNANNDVVLQRYAEILLIKAEALQRLGSGGALELVNRVRMRSDAPPLESLSLQDIEDERARELLWEGTRRRDMIRFGDYFTGRWSFKTSDVPEFRGLYPIPQQEIDANPNLEQNSGY